MNLLKCGKETAKARQQLLKEQKSKLLEKQKSINETIDRLNYKLSIYDEIISGKRKDFTEEEE